ncbi:MAG TPA: DUF979 domain-containing protein [Blastocatellia bacterium]|jgi:uncharacterized membrane protein|nr:DUF979 domain-containing protein [Blastocatellia bacterium]
MIVLLAVSPASIIGVLVSLDMVYALTGVVLWIFAAMTFADRGNPRRIGTGCFWFTLGVIFIAGSLMPHWLTGLLVILMVALDGAGQVARGRYDETTDAEHAKEADRLGNKIFIPVLVIPFVTFGVAVIFRFRGMDANAGALVGLGFGGISAMAIGLLLTGGKARAMMDEGRRINDAMGTVNILPQLLGSLGVIFTAAKIGDLIAGGITSVIPQDNLFLLVLANCLGMALFTIVMGNSFAAFPVIATGVLVPLIIKPFGVNPAMVAIITLTAGSSGTLMTPMAANFNIVPTALLNMRDQYGVIKFQLPYAFTIWMIHVILMWAMIKL